MIDIDKRSSKFMATLPGADIIEHVWVNSNRLACLTGNVFDAAGTASLWRSGGLFAVDHQDSAARRLALPMDDDRSLMVRSRYTRVMATLADGSDNIIVAANECDFDRSDVYRLNTRTLRKPLLSYGNPGDMQAWTLDRDGMPRAAHSSKGTQVKVLYRRDEKLAWIKWSEGDFREPLSWVSAVGYDGNIVGLGLRDRSVATLANTRLTSALLRLDERGQTQQVLASRDSYDFTQPVLDPVEKNG